MTEIGNNLKLRALGDDLALTSKPSASAASAGSAGSFQDVLKSLVDEVDTLQKSADASIKGLATGQTTDVHDVTVKMEEAGVAFELMMEIRNKLVDAYQQILRMQP
jgi:flagellar hook-basal body complex protein FliE